MGARSETPISRCIAYSGRYAPAQSPRSPALYASASCADDAITQDPATAEAFTSIIESSPLRTDALLDFVHIPFGEFFSLPSALADSTRIPVIHAANPPFPYPRVPLLIAIGSEDSIAADGRRLYPLLQRVHPYLKFLDIPGRDHVSALTSGVF